MKFVIRQVTNRAWNDRYGSNTDKIFLSPMTLKEAYSKIASLIEQDRYDLERFAHNCIINNWYHCVTLVPIPDNFVGKKFWINSINFPKYYTKS